MKVLMIGNSFSICVGKNLPQIVKAGKKHRLQLTSACIGGCSLETHADHLAAAAVQQKFAPYFISEWDSQDARVSRKRFGNVLELLQNVQYDIITIQQASHYSWDYATYQPFANNILAVIRKFNPHAQVMIQQTWSYRNDSPRLAEWGFDADGMYLRARKAYQQLAEETGSEVIPAGDAVDIFRKKSKRRFKALPESELKKYRHPDLPPSADDIVGASSWHKNGSGAMVLSTDTIHLNYRGEYLQACVWYGKLFGEDPENITYEHPQISDEECRAMRKAAAEALK